MFTKKGYSIVLDEAKADFILGATGEERYGKFLPEAHSVMGFRSHDGLKLITQTSIRCYTQSCAVSDFIKSFNKSYKKMSKALPSCK